MRVVHNSEDSSLRALMECWRKDLLTDPGLSMCGIMTQEYISDVYTPLQVSQRALT